MNDVHVIFVLQLVLLQRRDNRLAEKLCWFLINVAQDPWCVSTAICRLGRLFINRFAVTLNPCYRGRSGEQSRCIALKGYMRKLGRRSCGAQRYCGAVPRWDSLITIWLAVKEDFSQYSRAY